MSLQFLDRCLHSGPCSNLHKSWSSRFVWAKVLQLWLQILWMSGLLALVARFRCFPPRSSYLQQWYQSNPASRKDSGDVSHELWRSAKRATYIGDELLMSKSPVLFEVCTIVCFTILIDSHRIPKAFTYNYRRLYHRRCNLRLYQTELGHLVFWQLQRKLMVEATTRNFWKTCLRVWPWSNFEGRHEDFRIAYKYLNTRILANENSHL